MKPSELARAANGGSCRVLIELLRLPDETDLSRLRAMGLEIERVVDRTLIGRIAEQALDALRSEAIVAAVERSEELGLH